MEDVQPETHRSRSILRPQCVVELPLHIIRGVEIILPYLLGATHPLISARGQKLELPTWVIQGTLNVAAQNTPDLKINGTRRRRRADRSEKDTEVCIFDQISATWNN